MKKIICACDFSKASNNAAHHAARIVSRFGSQLCLLHIYNVPVPVTEFGYIDINDEVLRDNARKELDKLSELLQAEHPHLAKPEVIVESGLVVSKINKTAEDKDVDLIVMGIENQTGFVKEHVLGSTSIDETRQSKIPVLIVPAQAESKKIGKIVFACDYKNLQSDSTALIQIKYYKTLFDAELILVHVLEPEHQLDLGEASSDYFIEQSLANTEHKTFFVYEKNAARGILEFVDNHQVDLIIVEPRKRNFWERLFGKSTTQQLAFHLNIPMLAIDGKVK